MSQNPLSSFIVLYSMLALGTIFLYIALIKCQRAYKKNMSTETSSEIIPSKKKRQVLLVIAAMYLSILIFSLACEYSLAAALKTWARISLKFSLHPSVTFILVLYAIRFNDDRKVRRAQISTLPESQSDQFEDKEKHYKDELAIQDKMTLDALKYFLLAFGLLFPTMLIGFLWQEFSYMLSFYENPPTYTIFLGLGFFFSARYMKKCHNNIPQHRIFFRFFTMFYFIALAFIGFIFSSLWLLEIIFP